MFITNSVYYKHWKLFIKYLLAIQKPFLRLAYAQKNVLLNIKNFFLLNAPQKLWALEKKTFILFQDRKLLDLQKNFPCEIENGKRHKTCNQIVWLTKNSFGNLKILENGLAMNLSALAERYWFECTEDNDMNN